MELRHLRYFVAVADELNFTRAAARLHLAQPSLTRQIRDLEGEVAVQLFDRTKNRISLTKGGKTFLADARRLLSECDNCVRALQVRDRRDWSPLQIGYVASIFHHLLPLTLAAFHRESSQTELQLFDMVPAEQRVALEEGKIDLALAGTRLRSNTVKLASACVGCHEMIAALPSEHALAHETQIDLLDLEPMYFICMSARTHPGAREWLISTCRHSGFAPKILHEAERESVVVHLVASGLGVALLPETSTFLAHHRMVFRALRQRPTSCFYAIWRADNESASLKRYVEMVTEIAIRSAVDRQM